MESLNTESQEPAAEDVVVTSTTACADARTDESNSAIPDADSSCKSTDDNSSAVEKCAATSLNPYSYVQRGDYTSEVFKLELMNLPRRFGIAVSRFSVCLFVALLNARDVAGTKDTSRSTSTTVTSTSTSIQGILSSTTQVLEHSKLLR